MEVWLEIEKVEVEMEVGIVIGKIEVKMEMGMELRRKSGSEN